MLRSKKNSYFFCLLALFLCDFPQLANADDTRVTIRRAQLVLENDSYVLDADIEFDLSEEAKGALNSGIPLSWEVVVKIQQERKYLWNKTVIEKNIPFQIRYYPLINIYQFIKQNNEEGGSFISLSSALEAMGTIRGVPLFKQDELGNDSYYLASVRVLFDKEDLPLPLRPVSYFDDSWDLSSDWLQWPVKLDK